MVAMEPGSPRRFPVSVASMLARARTQQSRHGLGPVRVVRQVGHGGGIDPRKEFLPAVADPLIVPGDLVGFGIKLRRSPGDRIIGDGPGRSAELCSSPDRPDDERISDRREEQQIGQCRHRLLARRPTRKRTACRDAVAGIGNEAGQGAHKRSCPKTCEWYCQRHSRSPADENRTTTAMHHICSAA